jgi:hypothetical protein
MIRIERAIRIEAPADLAWRVLGDFSLSELLEGICTRVTVDGAGIGAVRTMFLEPRLGGGYVKERLESFDADDRYMSYRMVDSGPVPFGDYLGSIRVTPAASEACVVVMTASFVPVEIEDEAARAISVTNITTALANARKAILRLLHSRPIAEALAITSHQP